MEDDSPNSQFETIDKSPDDHEFDSLYLISHKQFAECLYEELKLFRCRLRRSLFR